MENALTQLIQTQTQQAQSLQALQDAITTLGRHLVKPEGPTEPSKVLTKQTAQKACRDLSPADVNQYGALKAAILAHYGHNLQTRAQQFHAWEYDATAPVRPQIATLMRLTRSWLTSGEGLPAIDRVAMDRCIRALPGGAKRHASQSCPETVDALVTLLENHQVTVQLMQSSRPPSQSDPRRDRQRLRKSDTEALGPSPRLQGGPPQPSLQRRPFVNPDRRKCFACGQEGHIAWNCPGEDILMPTAGSSDSPRKADSYLTTCWAHEGARAPKLPVRIGTQDAEALLDSGSAVTLLRPGLTSGPRGPPIPVSCVHGDSREYPTTHIKVQTTRGTFEVVAGLVENLPVPVLIGRDCPIFWRLWACRTAGHRRNCPTKKPGRDQKVKVAHACAAPSSPTTSSAEGTEEEAPAPAEAPTRRGPRLTEGSSNEAFSEFPPAEEASSTRPGQFGTAQWEDPNLEQARQNLAVVEGEPVAGVSASTFPHFSIKNGLLYRVAKLEERVVEQLLVPKRYINKVLYLAHSHLLGAHLGVEKTYDRVRERFYWPGVKKAVQDYCQICPQCQKTAPKVNYQNPLIPLPIIDIPFQRVAMDIVGPLPKSSRGHRFILVIMDYATRYPEAVPLRTASAKAVARELFLLFSRVGIAKEVLTDQGTCFMSRVMKEMCKLLKVSQIRTSVYHPQTDGLVERFNKTLKQMLRKAIDVEGKNWDQLIPFVLFSIREVPQASTGFSPFELLYGRRPRGMLDLAKEAWEQQPSAHRSAIEYVDQMQDRMAKVWPLVREHMQQAQHAQARIYNRRAQLREFQPEEFVLVLIPTVECKFLAKWHGPYEVIERVGEVNYKVRQPGRRKICQIYHINLLKRWHAPDSVPMAALTTETQDRVPSQVPLGPHLSPTHRQDMVELTGQFKDVFSDMPEGTTVINHDIITEPGKKVRLRPYRIPEAKRETIKEEVPLTETAKEKTAFATPEGLYHYRVLPFGVHGAPATFQRMMDQVLRPHREYAAAYLDDVVIHSPDWTTHVGHLKAVLGSLRRAGLTANPKKCHLGLEEAEYLGYTIGRGSVRPQSRKVEAIATWPKPATKRQVKTFLGLVGYYQCFIPHFATIAAPLHEMTKNSHPHQVLWSTEAEAAFTTLRRALCTEPILSTPNFEDTSIVHTDASGSGLGAVLSQVRGGEEHPVTYISRREKHMETQTPCPGGKNAISLTLLAPTWSWWRGCVANQGEEQSTWGGAPSSGWGR
ncbi:uncharacterized protein LOC144411428 [Gasterosteus aculeatus]